MRRLLADPKERPGGWYIAQQKADAQLLGVGPMDAALDALREKGTVAARREDVIPGEMGA